MQAGREVGIGNGAPGPITRESVEAAMAAELSPELLAQTRAFLDHSPLGTQPVP